jgi:hypothetical protein
MRPLTAVTMIVLGSSFAITFSLAAVLLVVLILGDEYPRLQREFDPLMGSFVLFVIMTAISAASFYALIKQHRLWVWAQGAMWCGLCAIGWYYWP